MKIATKPLLPFALFWLLAPARARAVEPLDTFSIRVGGYITSWDTKVRAESKSRTSGEAEIRKVPGGFSLYIGGENRAVLGVTLGGGATTDLATSSA